MQSIWSSITTHLDPKKTLFVIFVIILANKVHTKIRTNIIASRLYKKAQEKRKQRDALIATQFTPPSEISEEKRSLILSSSVTQLSQLLNDDKITSEEILRVYHSRAITFGLSLELIAESNYDEALETAKKCDEIRKKTPRDERHKLGGLFGIPISIKDSFIQKGLDSTCGQASLCFKPNQEDGEILDLIKSRGAIPFIRSNAPQTLALLDCVNYIWGRGLNPWNKTRAIGGSSGGEGGLISSRCSPIGLGSDALGSIRIPASFCGIVGYKPTTGRYCMKGHSITGPYAKSKFSIIMSNNGPLTRCVDDSVLFMKELIREEGRSYDPAHPFIPWNEEKYQQKKFNIGYVISEDFFGASKSSRRAVEETIEALRKAGHTVAEVKLPNFEKMVLLMVMIMGSEGGSKGTMKALSGEEPVKELKGHLALRGIPDFIKKIVRVFLKKAGMTRLASLLEHVKGVTVEEYHAKIGEYFDIRNELHSFFVDNKLDAIITPAMPLPAFKHGFGMELGIASCYNWPANCANLPAGVLPVTKVKEGEDVYTDKDSKHNDKLTKQCNQAIEGSVGLPVNVQVMSLPWEDEKCLAVMKTIEGLVQFNELPPLY